MAAGGIATSELVRYGVFALAGAAVLFVLSRLFSKTGGQEHVQKVECTSCGWQGTVSRYAGRCPRCNNTLGEQRARK